MSELKDRYYDKIVAEPDYWWAQAEIQWQDARKLLEAGGSRQTVCNLCHGTLERALKALLAEQGNLSDSDKRHGLVSLCRNAGILDKLDVKSKGFVHNISDMHTAATYPDEVAENNLWNNDDAYQAIIIRTAELYRLILNEKGKTNGEGAR